MEGSDTANKYGFVYRGAIEENVPGKVNVRPVEYEVDGIRVAANLYLPADKTDDQLRATMATMPENTLYRDGIEYYGLSHKHPHATGSYTSESFMELMAFDVEDRMDLVDQPLLMIAGEKADTLYMSQDAFAKASGTYDKELFLIPGASHIRTYWVPEYVDQAVAKLDEFFGSKL